MQDAQLQPATADRLMEKGMASIDHKGRLKGFSLSRYAAHSTNRTVRRSKRERADNTKYRRTRQPEDARYLQPHAPRSQTAGSRSTVDKQSREHEHREHA